MPRTIKAPTMHELHDKLCSRVLYSTRDHLDYVTGMDAVLEHVYAEAASMQWEYDLKRVWVPPQRWTTMIRQYVDPEEATRWLKLIETRHRKKAAQRFVFRTNTVSARTGGKSTVRNLGSCMLTLSLALEPAPVVTLHSRTCYMGYLSPLDMSVAYHLARMATERIGIPIEEFRFVWFLESVQFHQFRTIGFALGDEEQREKFLSLPVTPERIAHARSRKHHQKWAQQDAEGVLYQDMQRFVSYQRLRKRFHTEVFGYDYALQFETPENKAFRELPSTPVSSLTFEKIGLT
jgi:hypothetical protein